MSQEEPRFYLVTDGDYNDVYDRSYFYATPDQMDKYCRDQFAEGVEPEEFGSDSIGYCIFQEMPEDLPEEEQDSWNSEIEYYIEAQEITEDGFRGEQEIAELKDHLKNHPDNSYFHYGNIVDLTEGQEVKA